MDEYSHEYDREYIIILLHRRIRTKNDIKIYEWRNSKAIKMGENGMEDER